MPGYRTCLVSWIALVASACGAGDDGSNLSHYGDEMTESVDAVQAALSSHHEQVLAQTDLERVRGVERTHTEEMDMRMNRMQDAEDSMAFCGQHMNTVQGEAVGRFRGAREGMVEAMDDASTEMARHLEATQAAPDIDTAFAEERQHRTAMVQILGRLQGNDQDIASAMQAMRDDGMSMMCPMASHMHRGR